MSQKSLANFVFSDTGVNKVKCVFTDVNNNNHDHDGEDASNNGDHDDIGACRR